MSGLCRYGFPPRGRHRAVRHLLAAALALAAFGCFASVASAGLGTAVNVNIVGRVRRRPNIRANTHYFTTIQAAVNASTAGDWVLIEPGVYYEAVKVTSAQSGIWIRGMNRNTVIIDGQNKPGNGIEIYKANNVWVENLTVRNFDTGSVPSKSAATRSGGTAAPARAKSARTAGTGRYLTAYDTGLNGGYGIFTEQRDGRLVGKHLRLRLQRLGHVHRRVPGMQRPRHRGGDGKQRARLLGLELRRQAR